MRTQSYLKYLFTQILSHKKLALQAAILIVIANVARVIEPYLYKVIVDTLTEGIVDTFTDAHTTTLMVTVAIWAILALLSNITGAQYNYIAWLIGNYVSQSTHLNGYRRLLRLDYQKHKQTHSSKLCKIVDDADNSMWEMTNWWVSRIIPAGISFVSILIIAFSINIEMTVIALSVIPVHIFFVARTLAKNEDKQREINTLWQEKHEHMSDQITNITTYKLNPDEKLFMKAQKKYVDRACNAQIEMNTNWRKVEMLKLDVLARFLVMGAGIYFLINKTITLGTLFMFMGLVTEIFIPLHVLSDVLPEYSRRSRYIDKYLDFMGETDEVTDPKKGKKPKKFKGKIEFKDVTFAYSGDEDKPTLKNLSFTINPGEQVAIVGHSGAGKTTISSLITRLMDVTKGSLLIDDIDIRDYKQETLKSHVGTVVQDNALYNETIAANIGYGNTKATRKDIIAASKKAVAHEFIKKLPKGYDTLIGERGVRLSGGERQRLAIARAILKKPEIVILDEPTSALDSITEAKVQKGLEALIKNRTAVVIAHRLSTVRNADKIIVLEAGEVQSIGTHRELLKACKIYRDMVDLQTGGFLAE